MVRRKDEKMDRDLKNTLIFFFPRKPTNVMHQGSHRNAEMFSRSDVQVGKFRPQLRHEFDSQVVSAKLNKNGIFVNSLQLTPDCE